MCSKYVLSLSGLTWFSRPMQWRGNSRYNPCAPLCRANSCWCAEPSIVSGDRWSNEWRCLLEGWVKSWLPRDEWFSRCKANIQYMLVEDQANTRQQGVTADLEKFLVVQVPNTGMEEIEPFVQRMASVPRSGLHNPFKNPERPSNWEGSSYCSTVFVEASNSFCWILACDWMVGIL